MAASRIATALSALVLLPLGLAACGSDEDTPASPTVASSTAASPTAASPTAGTSVPTESPSEESTAEAPTTAPAAEAGLGDWCAALGTVAGGVQAVIPDQGEWTTPEELGSQSPGPDDTFTERVSCAMRLGETFEGLSLGITETQYPDEAAASEWIAALRDDTDPMASNEEVDLGDEALYTTYNAEMGMPPFISYSVTLREGDRVIRPSLRDYNVEAPADEATRRAQVLALVELLQR